MRALAWAIVVAALAWACGVKGPPRPPRAGRPAAAADAGVAADGAAAEADAAEATGGGEG